MAVHPLEPSYIFSLCSRLETEDGFLTLQESTTPEHGSGGSRVWGECSAPASGMLCNLHLGSRARAGCWELMEEQWAPKPA